MRHRCFNCSRDGDPPEITFSHTGVYCDELSVSLLHVVLFSGSLTTEFSFCVKNRQAYHPRSIHTYIYFVIGVLFSHSLIPGSTYVGASEKGNNYWMEYHVFLFIILSCVSVYYSVIGYKFLTLLCSWICRSTLCGTI